MKSMNVARKLGGHRSTRTHHVELPQRRRGLSFLTGLALLGGITAGCTVSVNGDDAGPAASGGDDGGGANTGNDASSDDGGAATGDDGGGITSNDGGADATIDGSMGTGPTDDGGGGANDGGLPPIVGCMAALYGTYVQRTDGVLLREGPPEQPVLDSTTGLPLAGVVSVQEGQYHGCAAVSGGLAECWQTNATNGNTSGQLGNGTTLATAPVYRATPVLTAVDTPLTNVVSVADGFSNMGCAITGDGKLWCWGDLSWLVDKGSTLLTGYAQAITTDGATPLTGVVQAALGPQLACALVQGPPNTVWCWGSNANDELGQGDTVARQYPTKVLGLANPITIAVANASPYYNDATICALDGSNVRCWGNNSYGATGANSATDPTQSPTLVLPQTGTAPLQDVIDIRPGEQAFSALRSDGTLWTWGYGAARYAANYGITNILAVGWAGGSAASGLRYVTSDNVYHSAMSSMTVNCGAL